MMIDEKGCIAIALGALVAAGICLWGFAAFVAWLVP